MNGTARGALHRDDYTVGVPELSLCPFEIASSDLNFSVAQHSSNLCIAPIPHEASANRGLEIRYRGDNIKSVMAIMQLSYLRIREHTLRFKSSEAAKVKNGTSVPKIRRRMNGHPVDELEETGWER